VLGTALVRIIGSDNSFIDYYQVVVATRRGLQNRFGIRIKQGQCCAVVQIGDGPPLMFGKHYPLPVTINTLASPLRSTVENHLLNYVGSDLLDVLAGKKSFQEALNSPMK
jgi:hypothetical protein